MKTNNPLKNWIPFKLDFHEEPLLCKWLYLADKKFIEPFFEDSTAKCRYSQENSKPFRSVSTLDGIIDFSKDISSVAPTAFIFHVSRCGSTLLAQLLSLDEHNIVIAEAPILDEVLREIAFQKPEVADEKINETLKSVINFLGQKRTDKEQNLFIKLDSWHVLYYDKLRQLYPKTPFIFSFRRPDEVVRSQVKESGMHASPGMIQPELFDLTFAEALAVERPVYIVKVLEKYFEQYLQIIEKDTNTLFIDYADGILTNLEKIEVFLDMKIELETKQKMIERTTFHSKNSSLVFEEPELKDKLPAYQSSVFSLYEQLVIRNQ